MNEKIETQNSRILLIDGLISVILLLRVNIPLFVGRVGGGCDRCGHPGQTTGEIVGKFGRLGGVRVGIVDVRVQAKVAFFLVG